jgi:endogenous inhibitor of DNA gyrase (YacG/DUF329 family)
MAMEKMASVKCPICEKRIVLREGEDLSTKLRYHLSDQHDIVRQEAAARGATPLTSAPRPVGTTTVHSKGLRGAEHRREEQFYAPEPGTAIPPRPKGLGDWTRKALGMNEEVGGNEEWARGEGYPSMTERAANRSTAPGHQLTEPAATEDTIECPICGRTLTGPDEPGLSQALEEHFRIEHKIEHQALPKMVQQ